MTVKILLLSLVFFVSYSFVGAQTTKPLAELDRQVKAQAGGFNGSKQPLATLFNVERKRLGKQFETELLKYLSDDVEKHYWISFFLEAPSYLQGNPALSHLALLIRQQGLSLVENRKDEDSLRRVVGLSATAAVLSEQLNLRALAKSYKSKAEEILASDDRYRTSFPGMTKEESEIYKAIEYEKVLK